MPDLLVKIYDVNFDDTKKEYFDGEIKIVRALSPDKSKVLDFINTTFNENWANECDKAFSNSPISCFIAIKERKIIGFACYNSTAKGFFGPTGVVENERNKGIGKKLLFSSLKDMWDLEYAYAIVGWAAKDAMDFYIKTVNASVIEGSSPGVYKRMIDI